MNNLYLRYISLNNIIPSDSNFHLFIQADLFDFNSLDSYVSIHDLNHFKNIIIDKIGLNLYNSLYSKKFLLLLNDNNTNNDLNKQIILNYINKSLLSEYKHIIINNYGSIFYFDLFTKFNKF